MPENYVTSWDARKIADKLLRLPMKLSGISRAPSEVNRSTVC